MSIEESSDIPSELLIVPEDVGRQNFSGEQWTELREDWRKQHPDETLGMGKDTSLMMESGFKTNKELVEIDQETLNNEC